MCNCADVLFICMFFLISIDRDASRSSAQFCKEVTQKQRADMYNHAKLREDQMRTNISIRKVSETLALAEKASALKTSLSSSVRLARAAEEEDRARFVAMKPLVTTVDANSSSIVEIPKELITMKKSATRYVCKYVYFLRIDRYEYAINVIFFYVCVCVYTF